MPSLWGMLLQRKETSRVTRRAFAEICPSCLSLLRECVVSLMNDCVVCTRDGGLQIARYVPSGEGC